MTSNTSPSSSSALSSPISDIDLYDDLKSRIDTRLSAYRQNPHDDTIAFLRIALRYLPKDGEVNLMRDILERTRNSGLKELRDNFVAAILVPCKAEGGETTQPPTELPSFHVQDAVEGLVSEIEPSTRDDQSVMKERCLQRDGFRCLITGVPDARSIEQGRIHVPVGTAGADTEAAHILPFSLGKLDERLAEQTCGAAGTWAALYRYFPRIEGKIGPGNINDPKNGITMIGENHRRFGSFERTLVPANKRGEYKLKTFTPEVVTPAKHRITLEAGAGVEPPDRDILAVHCSIAHILRVSGIGAKLDEYRDVCASEDKTIKSDGTSDLATMISRRLMLV